MILGVSHIVLTSTNLDRDRTVLETIGWKTEFDQRGLSTHPGKRCVMSTKSDEQGLVFMRPPQGLPVELIHYSDELEDGSASPLQITLPRTPHCDHVTSLTCNLEFSATASVPSTITHFVADMRAARRFWECGVGFTPAPTQPAGDGIFALTFASAVPAWRAHLRLVETASPSQYAVIDGPGFRCLSVVSSDLTRDHDTVIAAGGVAATGHMELDVNGKRLELEIIAGPSGVLLELLRPLR